MRRVELLTIVERRALARVAPPWLFGVLAGVCAGAALHCALAGQWLPAMFAAAWVPSVAGYGLYIHLGLDRALAREPVVRDERRS